MVLLVWCIKTWRNGSRYDYLTLSEEQSSLAEDVERKAARKASVDASMLIGQHCLKGTNRYRIMSAFPSMGCRNDRHWFLVQDSLLKTDRLLTITTLSEKSPLMQLNNNGLAKKAVSELFLALQHPFIQPVLDIDFRTIKDKNYVITVYPYVKTGSLKDLIFKTRCSDSFPGKSTICGKPLDPSQIKTYGRQILEAILFLRNGREFPPVGEHLHSGNIMVQDGVARMTGYENILLGFRSKIYPLLRKILKNSPEYVDTIAFGLMMYEMCTGVLSDCIHPSVQQLAAIDRRYGEVIQVIKFIFASEEQYPKLEEVSVLNLFRHIDLRELHSFPGPAILQPRFSTSVHKLMKQVWKYQRKKSCKKKQHDKNISVSDRLGPLSPPKDYNVNTRMRRCRFSMPTNVFSQDISDEDNVLHSPPPPPLPMHSSFSADDSFFKYTVENSVHDYEIISPNNDRQHLAAPTEFYNYQNYISNSVPSGMYKCDYWNWSSPQDKEQPPTDDEDYYNRRKWTYNYESEEIISPEYFSLDTVSLVNGNTMLGGRSRCSPRHFSGTSV
ncbi:Uncharacterised protein g9617 [Pycnogonum litorale]